MVFHSRGGEDQAIANRMKPAQFFGFFFFFGLIFYNYFSLIFFR